MGTGQGNICTACSQFPNLLVGKKFKDAHPDLEARKAESAKVRTKHLGKIPIICERAATASSECPTCHKEKFLAQTSLTLAKFALAVEKQLKGPVSGGLIISLIHDGEFKVLDVSARIGDLDDQFRDEDGYLYHLYTDQLQDEASDISKLCKPRESAPPERSPTPEPALMPGGDDASSGGVVKCELAVTDESWVWSMTDPRWEFSVMISPATRETFTVSKRYSEFDELQNAMCAELGEAAWPKMPQLPAPHTVPGIGKLFDTQEVAQQRRVELEAYLQSLLLVPGATNSMALSKFLAMDTTSLNYTMEFVTSS